MVQVSILEANPEPGVHDVAPVALVPKDHVLGVDVVHLEAVHRIPAEAVRRGEKVQRAGGAGMRPALGLGLVALPWRSVGVDPHAAALEAMLGQGRIGGQAR